jgi:pimeloyl-ACP methyl ester carboxylesterase
LLPSSSSSSSDLPPLPTTTAATVEERRAALLRTLFEAFRQGTAPLVREAQLLTWAGGWDDVRLHEISSSDSRIVIWHGTADQQSPVHMVRALARRLPRCVLHEYEGETHFTLAKHLDRFLEELLGDAARTS